MHTLHCKDHSDLIDIELLEELEDDLPPEDVSEIIFVCLEEVKDLITDLESTIANHDEKASQALGHKIKGCAASACAKMVAEIAGHIEHPKCSDIDLADSLLKLSENFQRTSEFFETKFNI